MLSFSFFVSLSLSYNHLQTKAFSAHNSASFPRVGKGKPTFFSNPNTLITQRSIKTNNLPLSALLPWETEEDTGPTIELASKLTHDPEKIGKLARLAVAFSPPGHNLKLKDLEHIEVVCLDESHIEIAVVMCEDECVSVLVPIYFHHICGLDGLEECVLHELDELDEEAEIKISTMHAGEEDESWETAQKAYDCNEYIYPDWWVTPDKFSMLHNECKFIMNLLNEDDFKEDIKTLALVEVWESLNGNGLEVHDAFVAEVGLAGIFIKARALIDGEDGVKIIEVPVPFKGDEAVDADTLRTAVLGTVASIHV